MPGILLLNGHERETDEPKGLDFAGFEGVRAGVQELRGEELDCLI